MSNEITVSEPPKGAAELAKLKPFRTLFLVLIIGSLTISAAFGIWVLLFGGNLGDTQWKILWTTLLVAAGSAICLVAFTSFVRAPKIIGIIAIILAIVSMLISVIYFVWLDWQVTSSLPEVVQETVLKVNGLGWLWAIIFAHAALILTLTFRNTAQKVILILLFLSTIAVGIMVSVVAIFELNTEESYFRILWSLIIVAVLFTIVLPVLTAISKGTPLPSKVLLNALASRAASEGKSVDVLLGELLGN